MKAKSNNLKIKKHYENAYVKTHCVCYAGEVVPYRAQQMSLVGGRADSYALRDTSNVNILYRSARQNSLDAALNTLRKFEKVSNGNVVYQTIDDFLESNISDGLFIPNRDWEIKGDVSKLFDKTVYESLRDFLITVYEKKYIDIRHGLVHAPAAEWIVPQVSVNFNFETDVDGLFVVGDGSGKTQGILSAAVSALRATNVIRQRSADQRPRAAARRRADRQPRPPLRRRYDGAAAHAQPAGLYHPAGDPRGALRGHVLPQNPHDGRLRGGGVKR